MFNDFKRLLGGRLDIIILLILALVTLGLGIFFSVEIKIQEVEANLNSPVFDGSPTLTINNSPQLALFQENTLVPLSTPVNPEPQAIQKIRVVITGYSSSPRETDDDPYVTAAGTQVRDGIIANNIYPFGTKIRIPELYGEKVFVVEDRMSWTKGNYQFDIWFPSYWQALNFGAKRTYIEILES